MGNMKDNPIILMSKQTAPDPPSVDFLKSNLLIDLSVAR
jgi:hypothetical protein